MSMLEKSESALLVRVDERQIQMKADMDALKDQVTELQQSQDRYSKKVDALINKSAGATAILMALGGAIVWVAENFFFK